MSVPTTSPNMPRRGRPKTGSALSDAERARRYREKKKQTIDAPESSRKISDDEVAELRQKLNDAENEIQTLRAQLAKFVTINDGSGKSWSIQERKGNARWQTVEKGLSKSAAEDKMDKLIDSIGSSRYSYRMIED